MLISEYVLNAIRTAPNEEKYHDNLYRIDTDTLPLIHAQIGICTEAGEIADIFKRFIFYGKNIDIINLSEELGDLLWYIAIASNELDRISEGKITLETIMQTNINKLKARYPEHYNDTDALNRDLHKEREILES